MTIFAYNRSKLEKGWHKQGNSGEQKKKKGEATEGNKNNNFFKYGEREKTRKTGGQNWLLNIDTKVQ